MSFRYISLLLILIISLQVRADLNSPVVLSFEEFLEESIKPLRDALEEFYLQSYLEDQSEYRQAFSYSRSAFCEHKPAIIKKSHKVVVKGQFDEFKITCDNKNYSIRVTRNGKNAVPLSWIEWQKFEFLKLTNLDFVEVRVPEKGIQLVYDGSQMESKSLKIVSWQSSQKVFEFQMEQTCSPSRCRQSLDWHFKNESTGQIVQNVLKFKSQIIRGSKKFDRKWFLNDEPIALNVVGDEFIGPLRNQLNSLLIGSN